MGLIATGSAPPLPAFAVPHKRRRLLIPALRRLLKPASDLLGAVRMLSVERAALEHALDRLRHVEPAAAHRRVEGHNAMRAQPQHQVGRLVASEIVPHTSNSRSGGRSCGNVKGLVRPACHTAQAAGVAAGSCDGAGGGSSARIALRCSRSHGCRPALVPRAVDCSRTWPVAGWNRVRILVVPPRMYSCGCVAGWPRGRHDTPGCGTAWKGPASSSHQTESPSWAPSM